MSDSSSSPDQKVGVVISISLGNLIQGTGIALGCIFLWGSTQPDIVPVRIGAMIAGYLLIYFSSHSVTHYLIGSLVGIKFTNYSMGGSSRSKTYPPVIRQIFERLPFFAAHTESRSMKAVGPTAKMLMFGSGIIGTVLFSTLAAFYEFRANVPGCLLLLIFNGIWQISSFVAETRPGGDLAKAVKVLKINK